MSDIFLTIGRVRRSMPRNADVMEICNELERQLTMVHPRDIPPSVADPEKDVAAAKFDKKSYQREYMKKRRAKK